MRTAHLAWFALWIGCGSSPSPDAPSDTAFDAGIADAPDAAPLAPSRSVEPPLIRFVDPFLGTGGTGYRDIGSLHPGPQAPFGMIRPGPDTVEPDGSAAGFLHCSGYRFADQHIAAISHVRLPGIGINDMGVVAFMPTLSFDASLANAAGLRSHFDKARERADVGHYETVLDDPRFDGEEISLAITASPRVGLTRAEFPMGSRGTFVFDLAHAHPGVTVEEGSIRVLPDVREIEGSVLARGGYSGRFGGVRVHFVARFDRAFVEHGTWAPGALTAGGSERVAADGGAYVRFDTRSDRRVRVAVAVSWLDVARARQNLDREAADLGYDRLRGNLEATWETHLARVQIHARYEDDARVFYTALRNAFAMPTLATDVDGHYRGLDGEEHTAEGFTYFTDFSLWDTYRTLHPLVTLLDPTRARDFARSLLAMGQARGTLPRWPLGTGETGGMVGDPAVVVLGDTWARGVRDFDVLEAHRLAEATANGRPGAEAYVRDGYIPIEDGGTSTARTLEYAIADSAGALLALEAGDRAAATRLAHHATHYRNVYDPAQGFFVGRRADGTFRMTDVARWDDAFTEGNALQYVWLAPHDPDGLAELMGGREAALGRLRAFFDESYAERTGLGPPRYYWQGNEPDIHAPYLFALWGDPAAGARAIAWARRAHFRLGPEGLPGNDDSGTMSAWFVFSALGFYPLAGSDRFVLGTPLFTRAEVRLGDRTLLIDAPEASPSTVVPRGIAWNRTRLTEPTLEHATLRGGGTLAFDLID